jgi:hypothetical protein
MAVMSPIQPTQSTFLPSSKVCRRLPGKQIAHCERHPKEELVVATMSNIQNSTFNHFTPREDAHCEELSWKPLPKTQKALILHGLRQPYTITNVHAVPPTFNTNELVIKICAIGLNPIDWKSV